MANKKNLKPFKKGNKAAVGHGRPPGSKTMKTLLLEAMDVNVPVPNPDTGATETKQASEHIVAALVKMAISGNIHHIREIWDRLEGKPMQHVKDHTPPDLEKLNLSSLTDKQLEKLFKDNPDDGS